ncbi:MAG: MATE family efflux transporter [bacterium]|nr:MATE family efflux transporter [bacterium]
MTTDMTKGKPLHLLLGFAVPLMIGNVFQQFYNFIDTVIVGRFIGADALAAVGTTGNAIGVMNSLMMGLSVGAGIVIAQYYGAHNQEKLRQAVVAIMELVVVFTVLISIGGYFGTSYILKLLQVPEEIIGDAMTYMQICILGMLGMTLYNATAAIIRSIGDSRTPLLAMVISCIVNVTCNLLFVVRFHLGVAGVAYGTVIAQTVSAFIGITHLIRVRKEIGIEGLKWKPQREMIRTIVKAGVPTAIQSSLISLGGMSVQGLVNTYGSVTMSAYAAVQKIDLITIQVVVALGSALSVFTGQNIGNRNLVRIKDALRKTIGLMLAFCSGLALVVLVFKEQLLSIFLDPVKAAASIDIGCVYMTIIGIAYIIAGIMNSYLNLIRGAGDVNASFLAGIAEITGRIVFAYLLVKPFGVTGIWMATPLSWGCGCAYCIYRYYSGAWKAKVYC